MMTMPTMGCVLFNAWINDLHGVSALTCILKDKTKIAMFGNPQYCKGEALFLLLNAYVDPTYKSLIKYDDIYGHRDKAFVLLQSQ